MRGAPSRDEQRTADKPVDRTQIWHAGPPESEIRFSLRHLVLAEIHGRVGRWNASFTVNHDQPTKSSIDVVIDAASLETGTTERDNHTRSRAFLNVVAFPEIRFRSREIRPRLGNRSLAVIGDLTIRGVTREIELEVHREEEVPLPVRGETLAFTARASMSRQEFGLRWHEELDRGAGSSPVTPWTSRLRGACVIHRACETSDGDGDVKRATAPA